MSIAMQFVLVGLVTGLLVALFWFIDSRPLPPDPKFPDTPEGRRAYRLWVRANLQ